jgi:hypothetical protein
VCSGRGGGRRADILPAVASLRSPEQSHKAEAPENACDNPRTHEPRNDKPCRIPDPLAECVTERRTQCLSERRPLGFGDSFGERVAISLSGRHF